MKRERINATVAITDLRNFTTLFESFQKNDDESFIDFIETYYNVCDHFANLSSFNEPIHINHMGDGFMVIFYGEHNIFSGYLYGITLFRILNKLCHDFSKKHGVKLSYGIGIEHGQIQKVISQQNNIETFLGSVINIATRIEEVTKILGRSRLIIGNNLYNELVQILYKQEYQRTVKNSEKLRRTYSETIRHYNEMSVLNQYLMLFYVSEYTLKGVDRNVTLFRLSPTLASNKMRFNEVMQMLCPDQSYFNKILQEIKKFYTA